MRFELTQLVGRLEVRLVVLAQVIGGDRKLPQNDVALGLGIVGEGTAESVGEWSESFDDREQIQLTLATLGPQPGANSCPNLRNAIATVARLGLLDELMKCLQRRLRVADERERWVGRADSLRRRVEVDEMPGGT